MGGRGVSCFGRVREVQREAGRMLAEGDVALVIGDRALSIDRAHYRVIDRAAERSALTGCPSVSAVCGTPEGRPAGSSLYFKSSLCNGIDSLIIERESGAGMAHIPTSYTGRSGSERRSTAQRAPRSRAPWIRPRMYRVSSWTS